MENLFSKKGFTVIELVLYMGLLAIFLTVLTQIFVASLDVQLESESVSSIEQDGKFILARLSYDITRAVSINQPSIGTPTGSTLQLVANGITYEYKLSGQNFSLTENGITNQLNSVNTRVSGLQFVRRGNLNGKPTITVSFTLTSSIQRPGGVDSKLFQTTIGTR